MGLVQRLSRWLRFAQSERGEQDEPREPKARADALGVDLEQAAAPLPVDGDLDLHTFRAKEARDVVASYLEVAQEAGLREVRVVHGKGTGTLKRSIQSLLRRHPAVLTFADAPAHRGGWGATLVQLKPRQADTPPAAHHGGPSPC